MRTAVITKALLALSFGLCSVAFALIQDNADKREELAALGERVEGLEDVKWRYEAEVALKGRLHRKLIESLDFGQFPKLDASVAADGRPFVVVVSTSLTCGSCLFAQLDQWREAMAAAGVPYGKLLLVMGDENARIKQQVVMKNKVGLAPFAFAFVAEAELDSLLRSSPSRPPVPVSFIVDEDFKVVDWHYSEKRDEEGTAKRISDWLNKYFTSPAI